MFKYCWLCTRWPATCCWYTLYSSIHLRASLACAATCRRHTRRLQTCICKAHSFLAFVRLIACNSCLMAPKRAIANMCKHFTVENEILPAPHCFHFQVPSRPKTQHTHQQTRRKCRKPGKKQKLDSTYWTKFTKETNWKAKLERKTYRSRQSCHQETHQWHQKLHCSCRKFIKNMTKLFPSLALRKQTKSI